MPLNITVHDPLRLRGGAMAQVAMLTPVTSAQVVALGAASTALPAGALVCLVADEDQRIGLAGMPGYAAPGAAGVKLVAGVERWYELPGGHGLFYLSCQAG